jgi:hypothetical protein
VTLLYGSSSGEVAWSWYRNNRDHGLIAQNGAKRINVIIGTRDNHFSTNLLAVLVHGIDVNEELIIVD